MKSFSPFAADGITVEAGYKLRPQMMPHRFAIAGHTIETAIRDLLQRSAGLGAAGAGQQHRPYEITPDPGAGR